MNLPDIDIPLNTEVDLAETTGFIVTFEKEKNIVQSHHLQIQQQHINQLIPRNGLI